MNEFYKQDVFFFVTTVVVIVLGLLLAVALVYFIKILNDLKYIARKARRETDNLAEDLQELRQEVRTQGFKMISVGKFFNNIFNKHKGK